MPKVNGFDPALGLAREGAAPRLLRWSFFVEGLDVSVPVLAVVPAVGPETGLGRPAVFFGRGLEGAEVRGDGYMSNV
jgi:hypothetical protein